MNEQLLQFMMEKLGGEDAVMKQFHADEIRNAVAQGGTIDEIISRLSEPAVDAFHRMEVSELFGLTAKPASSAIKRSAPKRKRATQDELETAREAVSNCLQTEPAKLFKIREIAEKTGLDKRVCQRILRDLRGEGIVRKQGEKSKAVWGVAA